MSDPYRRMWIWDSFTAVCLVIKNICVTELTCRSYASLLIGCCIEHVLNGLSAGLIEWQEGLVFHPEKSAENSHYEEFLWTGSSMTRWQNKACFLTQTLLLAVTFLSFTACRSLRVTVTCRSTLSWMDRVSKVSNNNTSVIGPLLALHL